MNSDRSGKIFKVKVYALQIIVSNKCVSDGVMVMASLSHLNRHDLSP